MRRPDVPTDPARRDTSGTSRSRALLGLLLLAGLTVHCTSSEPSATAARSGSVSVGDETSAPSTDATSPITYENLYANEADWPYHVELTGSWKPEGFEGEQFGWGIGVLVRVEESGDLRIDFGRFGQYVVPANETNVIREANRIARGEHNKGEANFVLAVVNKMVDPSTEPARYMKPRHVVDVNAYLLVAADPGSEHFAELVAALRPFHDRPDVMPVLLPQGGHRDADILAMCRAAGWTDPLIFGRYSPGYTQSILGDDLLLPSLLLQTPEGRVIHASAGLDGVQASYTEAIDKALGPAPEQVATPGVESADEATAMPVDPSGSSFGSTPAS